MKASNAVMREMAACLSLSLAIASGETPATAQTQSTSSRVGVSDADSAGDDAGSYVDGLYVARGWYGSQPSSITVTVTLSDDVISAVDVEPHATNPTSLDLQRRFASAVPGVVVGRPLADVRVGRLAGSSGTPDGFNDALRKIREDAALR